MLTQLRDTDCCYPGQIQNWQALPFARQSRHGRRPSPIATVFKPSAAQVVAPCSFDRLAGQGCTRSHLWQDQACLPRLEQGSSGSMLLSRKDTRSDSVWKWWYRAGAESCPGGHTTDLFTLLCGTLRTSTLRTGHNMRSEQANPNDTCFKSCVFLAG